MGVIGDALVEVGVRADDDQYRVVCLAAEFADSVEWAAAGWSSPGRWIAAQLDVTKRTANDWIRIGRALRALPVLSAALQAHEISLTKAKVLTRAATPDTEADLVALAMSVTAAELPKAIAAWSQTHEPDDVIDQRHTDHRGLTWIHEPDGAIVAHLRFAPLDGGTAMAAVDTQVMRTRRTTRDPHNTPSLAQQRLDALIELITAGGTGVTTEVIIHVRGDGITLDDGTPLTASTVAKLLPDAFVRALIHDAQRRPINASGKQRHPTERQRRVVHERDRACIDCGSHDLLQHDHDPDYESTRRTVVEELHLRCATCHRFRHRGTIAAAS